MLLKAAGTTKRANNKTGKACQTEVFLKKDSIFSVPLEEARKLHQSVMKEVTI